MEFHGTGRRCRPTTYPVRPGRMGRELAPPVPPRIIFIAAIHVDESTPGDDEKSCGIPQEGQAVPATTNPVRPGRMGRELAPPVPPRVIFIAGKLLYFRVFRVFRGSRSGKKEERKRGTKGRGTREKKLRVNLRY